MRSGYSRSIRLLIWNWCESIWRRFQRSVAVALTRDRSAGFRSANVSTGSSPRAAQSSKPLPSTPAAAATPPPPSNTSSPRWSSNPAKSCNPVKRLSQQLCRSLYQARTVSNHFQRKLARPSSCLTPKARISLQTEPREGEHGRL